MLAGTTSATESGVVHALVRAGAWAAVAGSVLTIVWLVTMVVAPPSSAPTALDRLRELRADDARWSLMFVVVLPLGLTFVPVWIGLAARAWRRHPVAAVLTVAYGLLYAPVSTTAYWLQLTAARGLADAYEQDPAGALAAYRLFDFGAASSLTMALDVLGYAVLGLGTLAAAVLLWSDGRLGRVAGLMFIASAVCSIGGAVGIALRWDWLGAGAIAGGAPFLVAMIVVAWLLWSLSRAEGVNVRAAYTEATA